MKIHKFNSRKCNSDTYDEVYPQELLRDPDSLWKQVDKYWTVRVKLAKDPNTPKEVLDKLASLKMPGVPLERIPSDYFKVRHAIVDNPNVSKETLEKLAKDSDFTLVRKAKERLKSMNSRNCKFNSRKINSNSHFVPDAWSAINASIGELLNDNSDRTLNNVSIIGQALMASLAQFFDDVDGAMNALIDGIRKDNNVYWNSRSTNSDSDKYIVWVHKLHDEYTAEITDSDKGPTMNLSQAPTSYIPVNALLTMDQATKICDKFDSKLVRRVTNFGDILSILNEYARSIKAPLLDKLPDEYYRKIHKSVFGVPSDSEIENLGLNPELFH